MNATPDAAMLLPETLVAGLAAIVLFYAWRGLAGLPLAPRLVLGAMLGILVPGAFGLSIVTLSPHGAARAVAPALHASPVRERAPAATPAVEATPVPAAAPHPIAAGPAPDPAAPASAPVERDRAEPTSLASATATTSPVPVPPPAEAPATPTRPAPAEVAAVAPVTPEANRQRPEPQRRGAVEILFGTDRVRSGSDTAPLYSSRRAGHLDLGSARLVPRAGRQASAAAGAIGGAQQGDPYATAQLQVQALSRERFAFVAHESSARRNAIVLIHGYNTGLDTALADAAGLAARLDTLPDGNPPAVYLFSWPSAAGIPSYSYDAQSAANAAAPLSEFITLIAGSGAGGVSLVAFDLGAETMLAALAELPPAVTLSELVLVAPDLPSAGSGERIRRVATRAAHITLYSSEGTRALDVARRFHGGSARAGEAVSAGPLSIPGADSIVLPRDAPPATPQHDAALLEDLAVLLSRGAPADKRSGRLEPKKASSGTLYWRLSSKRS